MMNKTDICFVRAKLKEDYVFDGIQNMGYQILIPYTDRNLFLRALREVWFRLNLPCKQLFYNRKLKKVRAKCFIVKDPLITPRFLAWLRCQHKESRIILEYDNRVAASINPNEVDDSIDKWSYDPDDCEKYCMRQKPAGYLDVYRVKLNPFPSRDILYLGRDKGRLAQLLELQRDFENAGLRTYFHICATRRFFVKKEKNYKPLLTYREYLELLKDSRAILNIMPERQKCVTQREMECVFDGIKCFTNNLAIKNFSLYHPSRFFILGEDDWFSVTDFIQTPYLPVSECELEKYTYQQVIEYMLGSCDADDHRHIGAE